MFELNRSRLARLNGWSSLNTVHRRRVRSFLEQYLGKRGWAQSVVQNASVDLNGPVPWYTYPAIRALERIVPSDAIVFEYGSGNSTLWWQSHAKEVVSVEHDPQWYKQPNTGECPDVRLREAEDQSNAEHFDRLREDLGELSALPAHLDMETLVERGMATEPFLSYIAELMTFPHAYFDVIIIDGMAREACAQIASDRIKPGGIIVFDNSDRDEYACAYQHLSDQGFARIDYWGPGPINAYEWCTSIFTKSLDVFRC